MSCTSCFGGNKKQNTEHILQDCVLLQELREEAWPLPVSQCNQGERQQHAAAYISCSSLQTYTSPLSIHIPCRCLSDSMKVIFAKIGLNRKLFLSRKSNISILLPALIQAAPYSRSYSTCGYTPLIKNTSIISAPATALWSQALARPLINYVAEHCHSIPTIYTLTYVWRATH